MVECSKMNIKLSDRKLKNVKTFAKSKTGTTLGMSLKMFDGNDLPQILLTTRQNNEAKKCI